MNAAKITAALCLTAVAVSAQTVTIPTVARDPYTLGSDSVKKTSRYFRLATSSISLPADPAKGFTPTASTIHAVFTDADSATGFIPQFKHRVSTNGGLSWGPETVVHSTAQGEIQPSNGLQLFAEGRDVVLVFRSDILSTGSVGVVGYSSNDQGQTWNGPVLLTPAFAGSNPTLKHTGSSPSSAEFRCVYEDGKLHVHYEGVYTAQGAPNNEESFYSRASIDAQGLLVVEKADVPVSNLPTPNESDIDNVEIAADGLVVALLYQDQGQNSNSYNNTFVRVSRDGGDNWDAPRAITNFTPTTYPSTPSTDGNSNVAVSGNEIVVLTLDRRDQGTHGRYDELYADVSFDAGVTWQQTAVVSTRFRNSDTDDNVIAAQNGTFVISWYEDLGLGNSNNQNFVLVGSAAEIAASSGTLTNVSLVGGVADHQLCEDVQLSNGGEYIALFGEALGAPNGTSEAAIISWSCDRGLSWNTAFASDGSQDVDDPSGVVTLNGDFMTIFDQEVSGPNTVDVSGGKMPIIVDQTANNAGYELHCATKSADQFAIMLISGTAPLYVGFPLLADGSPLSFQLDALTSVGLGVPEVFLAQVSASGVAQFPLVPDLKTLTGSAWWTAVVTFDPQTGAFVEFTDSLKVD